MKDDIYVNELDNFMTDEECQKLIDIAENRMTTLSVMGDLEGYRIADGIFLGDKEDVLVKYRDELSSMTGIPKQNMEDVHIIKYSPGGEYKSHHDWFHPDEDYYEEAVKCGGQRMKTALVYLNDDFVGGETEFPRLNLKIIPQKGKLVVWDNICPDGSLSLDSMHTGCIVEEGYKYIAVIWMREKCFWMWDESIKVWYNTEDRWNNNEWYLEKQILR
jgi:prolyl 4-hydroxylase